MKLAENEHRKLRALVNRMKGAQAKLAHLVEEMQKAQMELHDLEYSQLPDMMHELGLTSVTLDDGTRVILGTFYKAVLPKHAGLRQKAFAWLRENGFGGLIKNEIIATLPVGKDKTAASITAYLTKLHVEYTDKQDIHHATLTAFVKEQFMAGNGKLPLDALGAFIGERVTIK